jgi:carbohydrate kinase (thermoresistant glucokinase family)
MIRAVLFVMGVSGVGKSTVAQALNTHLHWPFQEGDDFHPQSNVQKMHAGVALTDADRAPWLAAVRTWIDARVTAGEPGLITCSALKRAYRNGLVDGRPNVRALYLKADEQVIQDRIAHRTGHFMPATMLESQLRTLEEPTPEEHAITVDVGGGVEETVQRVLAALGAKS